MNRISRLIILGTGLLLCSQGIAHGGTATSVSGLYYTGVSNGGGLIANGTADSHWSVTYASANGIADNQTYQGAAYVVSYGSNNSGWIDRTNAQWIVPPAASNRTDFPGNGTTGTNAASYVYTLAFTIAGDNIGSAVTNQVSITLTLAADDQASVYINPTLNADGSINTASSKLGGALTSAWSNTQTLTLQNFDNGVNADNAKFVIGVNYLTIQVDNTNSLSGPSTSTDLNASGLLVYQTGSAATVISSKLVPEVGAWLPVLGALGLFCWRRFRTAKLASVA